MTNAKDIILSHSKINSFNACPRRFEFMNLYDETLPDYRTYSAEVGTCLHEMIQSWLIAKASGNCPESAAVNALLDFFPADLAQEQKTTSRNLSLVVELFLVTIEHPFWNEWELMELASPSRYAVEVAYRIRHESLGTIKHPRGREYRLVTQGKIDLIMRHKTTGQIRVVDIKTTSLPSEHLRAKYTYSGQQLGYTHVLQAMLGEFASDYTVSYFVAKFGTASEPPELLVLNFKQTQALVEDYWRNQLDVIDRLRRYITSGFFPRANGDCVSWGRVCSAFTICQSRNHAAIEAWFSDASNQGTARIYEPDVELTL